MKGYRNIEAQLITEASSERTVGLDLVRIIEITGSLYQHRRYLAAALANLALRRLKAPLMSSIFC